MQANKKQPIHKDIIEQAMSYSEYRSMINDLLSEGKTTGPKQSKKMTAYTRMNVQRMNRLDKKIKLNNSLQEKLESPELSMIWLVITEGWCGDAAQNVPVLNKMAEASSYIELKFILRDEHLDIMDKYLTSGGRSIPKLICLDAQTLEEIGSWGPRPGSFQQKAMEWKDDPEISMEAWAEKLHAWYAKDKTQTIQNDFEKLLEKWS